MSARLLSCAVLLCACGVPESDGPIDWEELTRGDAQTALTVDAALVEDTVVDASVLDASHTSRDGATPTSDARPAQTSEASTPAHVDAGPDAHLDAFEGAPAYASKPVAESAKQRMASTGVSPTKSACLACHNGSSKTPTWLSGGTVFRDLNATKAAPDLEVRIVDMGTKQSFSAHTDADGNFYLPKPSQSTTGPYLIGVRDGAQARTMPLLQRGLDCNGSACHGGAQGPIHLP